MRVLLCQAAGVQQGLVGSICELGAVHVGRNVREECGMEIKLISLIMVSCDTEGKRCMYVSEMRRLRKCSRDYVEAMFRMNERN